MPLSGQKTFVPQLIRILRRVRSYINKHSSLIQANVSGAQWTALQTIVTAIGAFDGVSITEQP